MEPGRPWRGRRVAYYRQRGRAAEYVDHGDADAYRKLSKEMQSSIKPEE